ncbi:MAG: DUF502 domain-containing protein [Alphaproteobacteria bacterium]|nr:DUF502 domain-containing protein [Alphaproteobacteria bacterium]
MKQEQTSSDTDRLPVRGAGLLGRLRGYIITGVLVTLPIWITIYFSWGVVYNIDSLIEPLIPARYNPNTYLPFAVPGIGLVVLLCALVVIGWVAASLFGRFLVRMGESVVGRMPFIRTVYSSTKQIVESVLAQKAAFSEVVLIEFPRRECWVLGFVTGKTEGEIQDVTEDEVINVFVPTTPIPTSGFLCYVARSEVVPLSMSVEDGMKLVVSGGIVAPPDRRPPEARKAKRVPAAKPHTVVGPGPRSDGND